MGVSKRALTFSCQKCPQSQEQYGFAKLQEHIMQQHMDGVCLYFCPKCRRKFGTPFLVHDHIRAKCQIRGPIPMVAYTCDLLQFDRRAMDEFYKMIEIAIINKLHQEKMDGMANGWKMSEMYHGGSSPEKSPSKRPRMEGPVVAVPGTAYTKLKTTRRSPPPPLDSRQAPERMVPVSPEPMESELDAANSPMVAGPSHSNPAPQPTTVIPAAGGSQGASQMVQKTLEAVIVAERSVIVTEGAATVPSEIPAPGPARKTLETAPSTVPQRSRVTTQGAATVPPEIPAPGPARTTAPPRDRPTPPTASPSSRIKTIGTATVCLRIPAPVPSWTFPRKPPVPPTVTYPPEIRCTGTATVSQQLPPVAPVPIVPPPALIQAPTTGVATVYPQVPVPGPARIMSQEALTTLPSGSVSPTVTHQPEIRITTGTATVSQELPLLAPEPIVPPPALTQAPRAATPPRETDGEGRLILTPPSVPPIIPTVDKAVPLKREISPVPHSTRGSSSSSERPQLPLREPKKEPVSPEPVKRESSPPPPRSPSPVRAGNFRKIKLEPLDDWEEGVTPPGTSSHSGGSARRRIEAPEPDHHQPTVCPLATEWTIRGEMSEPDDTLPPDLLSMSTDPSGGYDQLYEDDMVTEDEDSEEDGQLVDQYEYLEEEGEECFEEEPGPSRQISPAEKTTQCGNSRRREKTRAYHESKKSRKMEWKAKTKKSKEPKLTKSYNRRESSQHVCLYKDCCKSGSCVFCCGRHKPTDCATFTTITERKISCLLTGCCYRCLKSHGKGGCTKVYCTFCRNNTHPSSMCLSRKHQKHLQQLATVRARSMLPPNRKLEQLLRLRVEAGMIVDVNDSGAMRWKHWQKMSEKERHIYEHIQRNNPYSRFA